MTTFLDRMPPFDFADPAARDLWGALATNYQSKPTVKDFLAQLQVDTSEIDWDNAMRWVWRDILLLTHRRARLRPLLEIIAASGDDAVARRIAELEADAPVAPAPQHDVRTTQWKGFASGVERAVFGEPTFLDVAFLTRGVELGAAVCRLTVTLSGTRYYGTGFRIGENLLLTNHHVLYDYDHADAPATAVEAWFHYERSFAGLDREPAVVQGDPATIVGNRTHDWAVVALAGPFPDCVAAIDLRGATPVRADDRVYIIQHPNGAPKKIGMVHNVVRHVDDHVVQYLADTETGSSGAPVFNEQWQLVALHHQWVEVASGGARQIRNQGQRIERITEEMDAAGVL